jgi:hypothetical protein
MKVISIGKPSNDDHLIAELVPTGETLRTLAGGHKVLVTMFHPMFVNMPKMWLYAIGCANNSRVCVYTGLPFEQFSVEKIVGTLSSTVVGGTWHPPAGFNRQV